jgi:hypothetical protein
MRRASRRPQLANYPGECNLQRQRMGECFETALAWPAGVDNVMQNGVRTLPGFVMWKGVWCL